MKAVLLIGLGGALGAMCRYGISASAQRLYGLEFPLGTLLVNTAGCLAIGVIAGGAMASTPPIIRGAIMVGFLGGLTTFSTFGLDTISYFDSGKPGWAMLNIAANVVLSLLAVGVALLITRHFCPPE